MLSQEKEFNEEWFDVFLYYALIGISKPRPYVRIYSLNILNTIAKMNVESIMDVTEKVMGISESDHWEIKAQCLLFACHLLKKLRSYSYLLKKTGGEESSKPQVISINQDSEQTLKGGKLDRQYAKNLIDQNIQIIRNCFNVNAPKSV